MSAMTVAPAFGLVSPFLFPLAGSVSTAFTNHEPLQPIDQGVAHQNRGEMRVLISNSVIYCSSNMNIYNFHSLNNE